MRTTSLAILAVLCGALGLVLVASAGCPSAGQPQNPVVQDFLDCTHVDLSQPVAVGVTLVQDIVSIVEAGADGWEQALAQLALTYGNDALACGLKAAFDYTTAHPPHVQAPPLSAAALRAKQAIPTYLGARSFK